MKKQEETIAKSKSEAKRKAIMKGEDPVKAAKEFDKIKEKKSDGQTT